MSTRREFIVRAATSLALTSSSATVASGMTQAAVVNTNATITSQRIPHTELSVSRLAFGLSMWSVGWRSTDYVPATIRAIQTAHECGITLFDTADVYAGGLSESALGNFLKQSPGIRNRIVIQSKCGAYYNGRLPDQPISLDSRGMGFAPELDRTRIVSVVEGSLKRLGTDRLDILLLHVLHPLTQPEEVSRAFDELSTSGKVRYFGVSNHNVAQIELLKKYVRQPLVANQIWLGLGNYASIAERSNFGGLVDYCRANDISVQAYSPLRTGNLTTAPVLLNPPEAAPAEVKVVAKLLAEMGERYRSSPAAVMLSWLLRHPAKIIPIIGASKPTHITDNCMADSIALTAEEWSVLFYAAKGLQSAQTMA